MRRNLMTRTLRAPAAATLALIGGLMLASCAAPAEEESAPAESIPVAEETQAAPEPEPQHEVVSLDGAWEQTNKNSEDSYQSATITGSTMQIDWVTDGGDSRAVYWVGTVEIPADVGDSFAWVSTRDAAATDNAIMASTSDTKEFTYNAGELSYELTAMGVKVTVRMAKAG
jgi:hypothetical protein